MEGLQITFRIQWPQQYGEWWQHGVLLNSFLKMYNLETVTTYLHRCFRVVTGIIKENDYTECLLDVDEREPNYLAKGIH